MTRLSLHRGLKVLLLLLALGHGAPAFAHKIFAAYLEVDAPAEGPVTVRWTKNARDEGVRFGIAGCRPVASRGVPKGQLIQMECGELAGRQITIEGLGPVLTEAVIRTRIDGRKASTVLTEDEPTWTIPTDEDPGATAFFNHGIVHILAGMDHVLFVLGIILIFPTWKVRLQAVGLFSVGHAISVTSLAYGLQPISPAMAEILIALSLVYLALGVLHRQAFPHPVALCLAFGLIHGLGFGGIFVELVGGTDGILMSLVTFHLGIDFGQLALLGVAALAIWTAPAVIRRQERLLVHAAAYGLGLVACVWTVERLFI